MGKLRKYKSLYSSTANSFGTGEGVTITPASVVGLPTDTEIVLTFDRVDSQGTSTPSAMERIKGTIVGGNFVVASGGRGFDGSTEQSHTSPVVEMIWNATDWNDVVDAFLVAHTQTGAHSSAVVSASSVDTDGTLAANSDTKIPSQKAVKTYVDSSGGSILTTSHYAPDGFLINGKIVPSVASGNLSVAIKGMDGNDPSANNPVYVRIGDTVRTITSALSVTKNAGTNWFNSGSAELATKEIDYFVYLGYNATDGVVVGFSRIPYATLYSDFSATTTNEKYCAISTITNAASTDNYVNIGRFAATLSAGAGYTWSVPTFTSANLIQRPIFETRVLNSVATLGGTGSMTVESTEQATCYYKVQYREVRVFMLKAYGDFGGSAATTFTAKLPFAAGGYYQLAASGGDNSYTTHFFCYVDMQDSQNYASVTKGSGANWSLSPSTGLFGASFSYEIY